MLDKMKTKLDFHYRAATDSLQVIFSLNWWTVSSIKWNKKVCLSVFPKIVSSLCHSNSFTDRCRSSSLYWITYCTVCTSTSFKSMHIDSYAIVKCTEGNGLEERNNAFKDRTVCLESGLEACRVQYVIWSKWAKTGETLHRIQKPDGGKTAGNTVQVHQWEDTCPCETLTNDGYIQLMGGY